MSVWVTTPERLAVCTVALSQPSAGRIHFFLCDFMGREQEFQQPLSSLSLSLCQLFLY